jgi:PST family polysaccharide transporter
MMAGLVIKFILNIILIRLSGIIGASISTVVSLIIVPNIINDTTVLMLAPIMPLKRIKMILSINLITNPIFGTIIHIAVTRKYHLHAMRRFFINVVLGMVFMSIVVQTTVLMLAPIMPLKRIKMILSINLITNPAIIPTKIGLTAC